MKDFDAEQVPTTPLETRAFKLGGQVLHYRDAIPGELMTMFATIDADSPVQQDMAKLGGMIFDIVVPEDHDTLKTALADRGPQMIDLRKLAEVIGWVLGESSSRPLSQPSGSTTSGATPTSTPDLTEPSPLQALGG